MSFVLGGLTLSRHRSSRRLPCICLLTVRSPADRDFAPRIISGAYPATEVFCMDTLARGAPGRRYPVEAGTVMV